MKAGLREIDHRRRRDAADAPAHDQRRDEDVRRVVALDRHLDHRVAAVDRAHERLEHALALDGDERGRVLERRAHLEARGLAGLVALLLGQEVDAVVVGRGEPPVLAGRDPRFGARDARVAVGVPARRAQDEVAGGGRSDVADQQPMRVGLPLHRSPTRLVSLPCS